MKIRSKILVIIGITVVLIVLINTVTLRGLIVNYIEKEEVNGIRQNYERAFSMIQREKEALESSTLDWSMWDDTYKFMRDRNSYYLNVNLEGSTLETLRLNVLYYLDPQGRPVEMKTYDLGSLPVEQVEKEITTALDVKDRFTAIVNAGKPTSGVFMVEGEPFLLSVAPITSSNGKASPNGVLIMGRKIGNTLTDYLSEVIKVGIKFRSIDIGAVSDLRKNYNYTTNGNLSFWIHKEPKIISSYTTMNDILGNPSIYLVFDIKRELYRNGINAVDIFGLYFCFALLTVIFISLIGIERLVTSPLKRLHSFMQTVAARKDTKARIELPGSDEVAELATITNEVLEALDKSYTELRIKEERFKLIMEATNDGYFDVDLVKRSLYISPVWMKTMGYKESVDFQRPDHYIKMVHPDDKDVCVRLTRRCLRGKTERFRVEFRLPKNTGEWSWILVRGKIVEYNRDKKPIRIIGTISDINDQKKTQEENLYLSQTDVVTSLKNRAYIESIIKDAEESVYDVSWVIMGDVNGLKIMNDSFGHQQGDELLRQVSVVLKKCCSADDIPARWGGDEFIVLVKSKDAVYVEGLIHRIKNECTNITSLPIKVSIALGCAQRNSSTPDFNSVLKLAEERMYRNKLLESRSARSAIISSLEQSLHEKHIETEEHTRRIKDMCLKIGTDLGLSQEELDELALLGILHDIGKIGIPETILMKPDKLNEEEWEVMKTHSEIGYRIAASTPELAHIAEEILCHHERYDGTGYPQGLKGKEIPKLSRLLAIVDSYDVMTHDRHYQKAISRNSAVEELRNCSGKQFDPQMVNSFLKFLDKYFEG